jgi:predicted molibdopterin-dependent oxidoreductase YjgC
MFRSTRGDDLPKVRVTIEGSTYEIDAGITVAAALLETGCIPSRTTPVTGAPRSPYCMMGVCFECLVEIDGMPNRQACMAIVEDGMRIRRQDGAARAENR